MKTTEHLAGIAVHVVDHGLPIEGVGDRLLTSMFSSAGRLVEGDVADVERGSFDQLELRIGGDRLPVLRVDEVVAVDLAGLQCLQASGVVGIGRKMTSSSSDGVPQ